jgi:hypothetical protein
MTNLLKLLVGSVQSMAVAVMNSSPVSPIRITISRVAIFPKVSKHICFLGCHVTPPNESHVSEEHVEFFFGLEESYTLTVGSRRHVAEAFPYDISCSIRSRL